MAESYRNRAASRRIEQTSAPAEDQDADVPVSEWSLTAIREIVDDFEELRGDVRTLKREFARIAEAVDAESKDDDSSDKEDAPRALFYRIRSHPMRAVFVLALVALAGIAGTRALRFFASYESTDDAQVDGHIAPISPRISGTVLRVFVEDNQRVKKGTLIAQIDPADFQVAMDKAEADLAQAESEVQSIQEQMDSAQARFEAAKAGEDRARKDVSRVDSLYQRKIVAQQDFDHSMADSKISQAGTAAAHAEWLGLAKALQSRRAAERAARAAVAEARLNLGYTRIVAPMNGIVGKRSVEIGERVQPGQQLMAIVETDDLWITANFMETQVGRMRAGLPVTVRVDTFDRDFKGVIESLSGASGEKYSLLPPENATGNYVKVVQRIPVRIRLAPEQQDEDALRPGMSVEATIWLK